MPLAKQAAVLEAIAKVITEETDDNNLEPPSTPANPWSTDSLRALAVLIVGQAADGSAPKGPSPEARERAMLRLLLTEVRPLVPESELGTKFGTAVPFSFKLDLPGLWSFCRELPFPLERTKGENVFIRRTLTADEVPILQAAIAVIETELAKRSKP